MGTQETQEAVMERDMKTAEFIFLAQEMVECSTVSDLTALGIRIGKDALHKDWHPALKSCLRYIYDSRMQTLKVADSFANTAEKVELSTSSELKV